MLRIVLKGIAAITVGGAMLIALLVIATPRLAGSEIVRTALRSWSVELFGAPVEWQRLEASLLPPRLTIRELRLIEAGGRAGAMRVTAQSAELRLALGPLLAWRLEVDSLLLRNAEFVVDGVSAMLLLPILSELAEPSTSRRDGLPRSQEKPDRKGFASDFVGGLRNWVISESRILVRDSMRSESIGWRVEDLELEAKRNLADDSLAIQISAQIAIGATTAERISAIGTARSTERYGLDLRLDELAVRSDRIDLEGALSLQMGGPPGPDATLVANLDLGTRGRARIVGALTRDGVKDVNAEIEAFDLSITKPLLPDAELALAGLATGQIRLDGEASSPRSASLDVRVSSGLLRTPDYLVEGDFLLNLEMKNPGSEQRAGRLALDFTTATLDYQGQFKKSAGSPAHLTTDFMRAESGEIAFESRLQLRDINEIFGSGGIGEPTD